MRTLVAVATVGVVAAAVPGSGAAGIRPPTPAARRQITTKVAYRHHVAFRAPGAKAAAASRQTEGPDEIADQAAQYANQRTAPGTELPAAAVATARADTARLPVRGGRWSEVTGQPFQAEPPGYNDPVWSNSGAGFDLAGGRTTALATDGGTIVYAAAADGGVWRSTNGGRTWTGLFQDKPTLSIGALLVDPTDHSLWVGTGEANTNSDAYQGQGVYRSTDFGRTFRKVGGAELDTSQVFRLVRDGYGHVYAATTRGLWRRGGAGSSPWQLVLKPDPNPTRSP